MGTRADFYVGRGKDAEWLGSIAWDGYPEGIPDNIKQAKTKEEYIATVEKFLSDRNDATFPNMGWPWPWNDSATTDFAYAFDDGVVYAACFGDFWFKATDLPGEEKLSRPNRKSCIFPDMSAIKNVDWGKRSGLIIVQGARGGGLSDTED